MNLAQPSHTPFLIYTLLAAQLMKTFAASFYILIFKLHYTTNDDAVLPSQASQLPKEIVLKD